MGSCLLEQRVSKAGEQLALRVICCGDGGTTHQGAPSFSVLQLVGGCLSEQGFHVSPGCSLKASFHDLSGNGIFCHQKEWQEQSVSSAKAGQSSWM